MPAPHGHYNKQDGLEIRQHGTGWCLYDTLTQTFTGSIYRTRYWLEVALEQARKNHRPIIVRWLYGIATEKSKKLGVTEGGYDA